MDFSKAKQRCVKALLSVILSAFLGVFLSMSVTGFFGGSSGSGVRIAASVLTVGLLCVFVGNCGLKDAEEDRKENSGKLSFGLPGLAAAAASLPALLSYIVLAASKGFSDGAYRVFKLINGWAFQICNLINRSASSKDLTSGQTALLAVLIIVPAAVYLCFYLSAFLKKEA